VQRAAQLKQFGGEFRFRRIRRRGIAGGGIGGQIGGRQDGLS